MKKIETRLQAFGVTSSRMKLHMSLVLTREWMSQLSQQFFQQYDMSPEQYTILMGSKPK